MLEIDKLMAEITSFSSFEKKKVFELNDGISIEILLSFRTEAVEDRDVTFNQIQGSTVKCPLPMNTQIPFIWQILSTKTL